MTDGPRWEWILALIGYIRCCLETARVEQPSSALPKYRIFALL